MSGKGDDRRPVKITQNKWSENWDRAFKKKKKRKPK